MASVRRVPFKRHERVAGGLRLYTTRETSRRMASVRTRGTAPELLVRSLATKVGLRYRTRNGDLPGAPDLANRTRRFAIFVHGCFWHRHAGCRAATTPKTNTEFWTDKFERNMERDRMVLRQLDELGYEVLVFWECELGKPAIIVRRLRRMALRV